MIDYGEYLSPMLTGKELLNALTVLPVYEPHIRKADNAARLIALSDLYRVYLPSEMSVEIYSKLYLALYHSLQKKLLPSADLQRRENFHAIQSREHNSVIGGADSFTVIGVSGIGKSTAINRALELISRNRIIELSSPFQRIIPCVVVQCPFDSSVKGLLLEILRRVDEELGTNYHKNAMRIHTVTTDMLIGCVSQVCLNNIGILVVDEIQNVCFHKNGKSLVGVLTQLINNSGISICMVGTPESTAFFENAMHLARRSLGLQYGALEFGDHFSELCKTLCSYQYVRNKSPLNESLMQWLYDHSGGITSVVVSLIHDAQEIAILDGTEKLDLSSLNKAYAKRMQMLHRYIAPEVPKLTTVKPRKATVTHTEILPSYDPMIENAQLLEDILYAAKEKGADLLESLRSEISVTVIEV